MANRILIAEDDNFLGNAYRVKFEKEGFIVDLAYDGAEALKMAQANPPQVVLLDLVMPNQDGFEFLRQFRSHPQFQSIPVIVTSNLSQPADLETAKSLGAVDYLVKTDTAISDIVAKVRHYLKV